MTKPLLWWLDILPSELLYERSRSHALLLGTRSMTEVW
jgi:hypothetical protein